MNIGIAAIFHDLGILKTNIYPDLKKLDDFIKDCLQ